MQCNAPGPLFCGQAWKVFAILGAMNACTAILPVLCALASVGLAADTACSSAPSRDLVLVHGFMNKHPWSDAFLATCVAQWGTGKVFLVFTGTETNVWRRMLTNGAYVTCCGFDTHSKGTEPVEQQAAHMSRSIGILETNAGLRAPFCVIAHSMGGLVSRCYTWQHSNTVAGLVTLGTPHQGSPLANDFKWAGFFLNATGGIRNLTTEFAASFTTNYPVAGMPFAEGGKLWTIRAGAGGMGSFGWGGELFSGWYILKYIHHTENDGLVPWDNAVIAGASNIADYVEYDHFDIVRQPEVARKAGDCLRGSAPDYLPADM